jgi:signal peptidase I
MIDWFLSSAVRHATAMRKHVQKILNHQRDILSPQAVEGVTAAIADLRRVTAENPAKDVLEKEMGRLEAAANKWLKPYPHAAWRENVEVLLVALAVAMGIRTFFLQPFKIPTGSMQPTLFGVESANLLKDPNAIIPGGLGRVREWFAGISYVEVNARNDGILDRVPPPVKFFIFNIKQTLYIGGQPHTIWFPPDYGSRGLEFRAELPVGQQVKAGQQLVKLKVSSGDHLFVDRLSYNFRVPKRGEIIVFETKGIPEERRAPFGIPGDQFYIKRLVALGGERVQVGDDRHLVINGERLDAATPRFHSVYSFDPKKPPQDSQYSGHVNQKSVQDWFPHFTGLLAPVFADGSVVHTNPPRHLMVMGDNTLNSLDSRSWGDFPADYVIGKSFFVYWPITDRFGWGYR